MYTVKLIIIIKLPLAKGLSLVAHSIALGLMLRHARLGHAVGQVKRCENFEEIVSDRERTLLTSGTAARIPCNNTKKHYQRTSRAPPSSYKPITTWITRCACPSCHELYNDITLQHYVTTVAGVRGFNRYNSPKGAGMYGLYKGWAGAGCSPCAVMFLIHHCC